MLVKVCLFSLQYGDCVLSAQVLGLLCLVRVLHVLIGGLHLIDHSGSDFVSLASERFFELDLLSVKLGNLILVEVQFLSEDMHSLLKTIDLSLKSGSVDCGLLGSSGLSVDDSNVGVYGVTADGGHILNDLF